MLSYGWLNSIFLRLSSRMAAVLSVAGVLALRFAVAGTISHSALDTGSLPTPCDLVIARAAPDRQTAGDARGGHDEGCTPCQTSSTECQPITHSVCPFHSLPCANPMVGTDVGVTRHGCTHSNLLRVKQPP